MTFMKKKFKHCRFYLVQKMKCAHWPTYIFRTGLIRKFRNVLDLYKFRQIFIVKLFVLHILCITISKTEAQGQYFDTLTVNRRFFGNGGNPLGALGNRGTAAYGAPTTPSPGYGAPTAPSSGYGVSSTPQNSYGSPRPTQPKPSYGSPTKPSYSGGSGAFDFGKPFKDISIPVPNIDFPNPLDFKAGVLRSKGRIASGLLHAKAGILRAGANILAQKAAALDKLAQAIPAMKAGIINQMSGSGSMYGGSSSSGYGAPNNQKPSYNAGPITSQGYGTPQAPSYNAESIPSQNYGTPQAPSYNANKRPAAAGSFTPSLQQTFNNPSGGVINPINAATNQFAGGRIPVSSSYNTGSTNNDIVNTVGSVSDISVGASAALFGTQDIGNNNIQGGFVAPGGIQSSQSNRNIFSSQNNNGGQRAALISTQAKNVALGLGNNQIEELLLEESSRRQLRGSRSGSCEASENALDALLENIFMGNEMIPEVLDAPPLYPLDVTFKTVRTFPGMRLTADMTRYKPMLAWPADPNSFYTVIMSNLDINSRRNRTLSEFWHWFVANVPGDRVDDGEVVFDLLFPLVLPEGDVDHRFGFFVFKQPRRLDYSKEGGPTDSCSPTMSNGRGPFKSTKNFQKKYNLELTASTFVIIDYSEASMDIACEWQNCIGDTINLVSPLRCGTAK